MKISINPNPDQIRFYARSALHAWDLLPEKARENVAADMTALLAYLDACENASGVVVVGAHKIERGIRLEVSWRNRQIVDLTDRYADDRDVAHGAGDHQEAIFGDVKDVRPNRHGSAAECEVNLTPLDDRDPQ
jgi:hypothetical protein